MIEPRKTRVADGSWASCWNYIFSGYFDCHCQSL